MYAHPRPFLADAVYRGLEGTGIRAVIARGFLTRGEENGVPPALIEPLEQALADVERLRATYASDDGRLTFGIAPCLVWMVDAAGFRATREFANATGSPITYHMAETSFEVEQTERLYGTRETAFLERTGFLGPDLLAVHCVKLDTGDDIDRLRAHDVRVSHNPISNMYLASGVAPIVEMDRAGLTVALASDGPASNTNQNMLQVLKFAALLHKVAHEDAAAMTAPRILEMATLGGARGVGMDKEIGSLEVGKRADIAVFALDRAFASPVHEPVSSLVYSMSGSECRTVLVDGQILMLDGRLTTIDEEAVLDRARRSARELAKRARISRKPPWA
jgi:5-methylthioadenosine/S-adenosylhomocysteine deaminase